jgi:hypothetical protein
MFERFDAAARRALVLAQERARAAGVERISPLHLLYGVIAASTEVAAVAGVDATTIERALGASDVAPPPPLNAREERALRNELRQRGLPPARVAELVARLQRQRMLGPVDLTPAGRAVLKGCTAPAVGALDLFRVLIDDPDAEALLVTLGVNVSSVREARAGHT